MDLLYNVVMTLLSSLQLEQLRDLATRASVAAMSFYEDKVEVMMKPDDSPVTQADLAVSELLEVELPNIANFHVLSEENTPPNYAWLDWGTYWLIDPIDGTKHFINRTGDFCICIALIHQHEAVLGLIIAPVTGELWLAHGATLSKTINGQPVAFPTQIPPNITVTSSAITLTRKQHQLLKNIPEFEAYRRGSALKFMDVAEGKANIYPKMGDTCEWDSAAAHCILRAVGGEVVRFDDGKPLRYGEKKSLLNPHFLAFHHIEQTMLNDLLDNYQQLS